MDNNKDSTSTEGIQSQSQSRQSQGQCRMMYVRTYVIWFLGYAEKLTLSSIEIVWNVVDCV